MQFRERSNVEALGWLVGAAALGFAVPAVFSGMLELERGIFLLPLIVLEGVLLGFFFRRTLVNFRAFVTDRWRKGLILAAITGGMVVSNVFSQPASPVPRGARLALNLLWDGIAYGLVDALLLTVLPVVCVWLIFGVDREDRMKWVGVCTLALLASAFVTGAYHLGYVEFRGAALGAPVIGNSILTLGYLLSRSPLAPVLAHTAMHVAAVLHGPATVMQLPPH